MTMGQIRTIQAGEFKSRCLALLDDVNEIGISLIITNHGRPVAELKPLTKPPSLMGSVVFEKDLLSPVLEGWDWEKKE